MTDDSHDDPCLPPVIGIIARLTDRKAAITIWNSWGGTKRYIPNFQTARGKLTKLVGPTAAAAISREFGGRQIDVPSRSRGERPSLKTLILNDVGTTREVAERHGCSERYVRAVRNGE